MLSKLFEPGSQGDDLKERLISLRNEIQVCLGDFEHGFAINSDQFASWKDTLEQLQNEMVAETFRIAIIGSVKAGKSTFGNYLLSQDLLKMGAGIITTLVTRVTGGQRLEASFTLKGYDQINAEIDNALLFLQNPGSSQDLKEFDLRDPKHRDTVSMMLERLAGEADTTEDKVNRNRMLLQAYLDGYSEMESFLKERESTMILKGDEVIRHRDFAARESRSVYVKEMLLTVPQGQIPQHVEIGDCQGVDSPNPFHMSAVLSYLLKSHLAVYLVSTRTGLREADVKLINALKTLGMADSTIFLLNVDLGEHDGLMQVKQQVEKTGKEISRLGVKPQLYAFSCLYYLLRHMEERDGASLSARDRLKLELWSSQSDVLNFSHEQRKLFTEGFTRILKEEQYTLKLERGLDLLNRVAKGMDYFLTVRLSLSSKDGSQVKEACEDMQERQKSLRSTLDLARNSLSSVSLDLKQTLKTDVDRFFGPQTGSVVSSTLDFIRNFGDSSERNQDMGDQEHIMSSYMNFYQDLTDGLGHYINQDMNLKIIEYAKEKESEIRKNFAEEAGTYHSMVQQLFQTYFSDMNKWIEGMGPISLENFSFPVFNTGLDVPLFSASVDYEKRTKAQIVLMVGLQKMMVGLRSLTRRIFNKAATEKGNGSPVPYDKGTELIKKNTAELLLEHIQDYKENFKYGYVLKLVDLIKERLYREMENYVQGSLVDLGELVRLAEAEGIKQQEAIKRMAQCKQFTQSFLDRLSMVQKDLHSL